MSIVQWNHMYVTKFREVGVLDQAPSSTRHVPYKLVEDASPKVKASNNAISREFGRQGVEPQDNASRPPFRKVEVMLMSVDGKDEGCEQRRRRGLCVGPSKRRSRAIV